MGEASAAIFEVHQMMLEDEDYLDAIHNMIQTEKVNAEYAVAVTGDNFSEMFASMDDDYMKARAADVKDISNRLVRNLSGEEDTRLCDCSWFNQFAYCNPCPYDEYTGTRFLIPQKNCVIKLCRK